MWVRKKILSAMYPGGKGSGVAMADACQGEPETRLPVPARRYGQRDLHFKIERCAECKLYSEGGRSIIGCPQINKIRFFHWEVVFFSWERPSLNCISHSRLCYTLRKLWAKSKIKNVHNYKFSIV